MESLGLGDATRAGHPEGWDWRERFRAAVSASGHVAFEWDLITGQIRFAGLPGGEIFGHSAADLLRVDQWVALIHPDDRDPLLAQIERSLLIPGGDTVVSEFRLRHRDGHYVWVESRGQRVYDDLGCAERGVGFLADISARKQLESRLALCALILQTVQEAVAVVDVGGRIVWCNAAFDQMFGCARGGSAGLAWAQFADPAQSLQRELQSQMLMQAAQSGFHTGHWRGRRADGALLDVETGVTCVAGDEAPLWIAVHRDVSALRATEKAVLEASLEEQSRIGTALHEGLGQELAGASMLLNAARADIAAGHDASQCLSSVEALLQSAVGRCVDLAQRLSPFLIERSGLASALKDLSRRARAHHDLDLHVDVDPEVSGIVGNDAYHVLRLAQSAVDFAVGAAGATRLALCLRREEDEFVLCVSGEAGAVPKAELEFADRLMRYRAAALGGTSDSLATGGGEFGWSVRAPARMLKLNALRRAS